MATVSEFFTMPSDNGTLVGFVKSPGKKEATMGWLLLARNQSKLHRTTITRLWNSSSLHDNDERENTKERFYVYNFTQSLFRYDFKKSFKEHLKTAFIVQPTNAAKQIWRVAHSIFSYQFLCMCNILHSSNPITGLGRP